MISRNIDKTIKEWQEFKNETYLFDPDSSPEALKYFQKIYSAHWNKVGNQFNDLFALNLNKTKRFYSKGYSRLAFVLGITESGRSKSDETKLGPSFKLAGDTDFNFKDEKLVQYTDKLAGDTDFNFKDEKLVQYTESGKLKDSNSLLNQLMTLHLQNHTLINMSLMPRSGSMNNLKGSVRVSESGIGMGGEQLDRQDTLISILSYYYEWKNNTKNDSEVPEKGRKEFLVISNGRGNEIQLLNFLNLFENLEDYCNQMFLINDRNLINDMVVSGSKPIISGGEIRIQEYLDLIIRYRKCKRSVIDSLLQ
ncbi:hypothetical protein [Lacticaseibacillus parakribbianus]|uniref:hypothetical protein n=1 Tax=Lacticaseibacillus parakribbianus TaxID=2970927 RepID=UPI0021CB39DD|nr:hypothetical protein [Lacticaseibacillus parakribbianus]